MRRLEKRDVSGSIFTQRPALGQARRYVEGQNIGAKRRA